MTQEEMVIKLGDAWLASCVPVPQQLKKERKRKKIYFIFRKNQAEHDEQHEDMSIRIKN